MTSMKDKAYLMAFADNTGNVYNVHITDDLNSHGTWEYIDFKFTLPHSCYVLIWRRDEKIIDKNNAKYLTKYVRDDLKDFVEEGKLSDSTWHSKIYKKTVDNNKCLVLQWDEMLLPEKHSTWKEFARECFDVAKKESEEILRPGSLHDRELEIYEGKMNLDNQNNAILDSYSARTIKYPGYKIPSDKIIKRFVTEVLLENYDGANRILSKHYDVFPATIDTQHDGDALIWYDFVNHIILFDMSRIPDFSLRIPSMFMGFFKHLSCVKDWKYNDNPYQSVLQEKTEAEKFSYDAVQRMLKIGIDPR